MTFEEAQYERDRQAAEAKKKNLAYYIGLYRKGRPNYHYDGNRFWRNGLLAISPQFAREGVHFINPDQEDIDADDWELYEIDWRDF